MLDRLKAFFITEEKTPATGWLDNSRDYTFPDDKLLPQDYILTDEINEDWDKYEQVLRDDAVKTAFTQIVDSIVETETTVEPASEKRADKKAAEFLEQQLAKINFDLVVQLMIYGFFWGKSVSEILLENDGTAYALKDLRVRNQRRFFRDGAWRLRLETQTSSQGIILDERFFWVFETHSHNANDGGVGLAQWLYWLVYFKRHLMKWRQQYLERFGSPPVVLFYPESLDNMEDRGKGTKDKLMIIGKNMRRDSVALIPRPADPAFNADSFLKLVEPTKDGSGHFSMAIQDIDKAIYRLILGQSATVLETPGKLGNSEEQSAVLKSIVKAKADLLMQSFNAQVVPFLIDINSPMFSGITAYPKAWRRFPEQEDLNSRSERDIRIMQFTGKMLSAEYVQNVYGAEYQFKEVEQETEQQEIIAQFAPEPSAEMEQLAAAIAKDLGEAVDKDMLVEFEKHLAKHDSFESAIAAMPELFKAMPKDGMAKLMGDWFAVAGLAGYSK